MLDFDKLPQIFDTATLAEWSGMPVRRWADYRGQGIGPEWFRAGDGARQVLYTREAVSNWINNRDQRKPGKYGAGDFGAGVFGGSKPSTLIHINAQSAESHA